MQVRDCWSWLRSEPEAPDDTDGRLARPWRLVVLLVGLWIGQFLLHGPSLVGRAILLPLDILAQPGVYLPVTPETTGIVPQDRIRADLVLQFEPERRFAAAEVSAGRLPVWEPYQFGGVPARLTVFSPLFLLKCSTGSPVVLAWAQLALATVAGLGMYRFLRAVAGIGFWAAAVPAWCYPLSGALVFWQGYPLAEVVCWVPWLLLAVDRAVRGCTPGSVGGVAVTTGLVLLGGQLDVAGLCLIAAGVFGVWRLVESWTGRRDTAPTGRAVWTLVLGWGGGFLLAMPYLAPTIEYAATGSRVEARAEGREERPPEGWAALPLVVLPDFRGSTKAGSCYLGNGSQLESAACAHAGLLATLLVAPLAWSSRRHRSLNMLCTVLVVLGLAWTLDLPGLVPLLRLPGLNLFSFNRFVFIVAFAVLVQAAVGLEVLRLRQFAWRWGFAVPAVGCVLLAGWCWARALILPEPVATQLAGAVERGGGGAWARSLDDVVAIQEWFRITYIAGAAACMFALFGWFWVACRPAWQRGAGRVLAVLLPGELLLFAAGQTIQCDPALYYPSIPALEQVAQAAPGRMVGYAALPANVARMHELRDLRGYDAIDPKRYVDLVSLAADPGSLRVPYAQLQHFAPNVALDAAGAVRLEPILDLLGVRHVVFRGTPPAGAKPVFRSPDYFVMENRSALPAAFVPRRVVVEPEAAARLGNLAAPGYDPREVAYVETPVDLPGECRGTVAVVSEIPTRTVLSARMETPGLIVLADRWDPGWHAFVGKREIPLLRANHALRGVVVSAGETTVEFRYAPAGFRWGMIGCGAFAVGIGLWFVIRARRNRMAPVLK